MPYSLCRARASLLSAVAFSMLVPPIAGCGTPRRSRLLWHRPAPSRSPAVKNASKWKFTTLNNPSDRQF